MSASCAHAYAHGRAPLLLVGLSPRLHARRACACRTHFLRRGGRRAVTVWSGSAQAPISFDEPALREWIRERGGFVHPALRIIDSAPCGARGVVAAEAISLEEVTAKPLVLVPAHAELTFERALETLEPLIPNSVLRRAPLHTLDAGALVALLLAHERSKGKDSDWWPFLASLPSQLPCPWALPEPQLVASLERAAAAGADVRGWDSAVLEARSYLDTVSRGMGEDYSEHIGALPDAIKWGVGIVSSRGFGGELRPGCVPYIDLVNHDARCSSFIWTNENYDTQAMYAVWSTRNGEPWALAAGDELYVDYKMHSLSALDAFLSHGFVPPELL